jgi:hypothetical protein
MRTRISRKFNRCVKSVKRTVRARKGSNKESAAIAICTKSVLHKRGRTMKRYSRGRLITQRKFGGGLFGFSSGKSDIKSNEATGKSDITPDEATGKSDITPDEATGMINALNQIEVYLTNGWAQARLKSNDDNTRRALIMARDKLTDDSKKKKFIDLLLKSKRADDRKIIEGFAGTSDTQKVNAAKVAVAKMIEKAKYSLPLTPEQEALSDWEASSNEAWINAKIQAQGSGTGSSDADGSKQAARQKEIYAEWLAKHPKPSGGRRRRRA